MQYNMIDKLRSVKIFNMAVFDFVMVFVFVFIIHQYLWFHPIEQIKNKRNLFQYTALLIILMITGVGIGIITHWIFRIKSGLSGHLGLNN